MGCFLALASWSGSREDRTQDWSEGAGGEGSFFDDPAMPFVMMVAPVHFNAKHDKVMMVAMLRHGA